MRGVHLRGSAMADREGLLGSAMDRHLAELSREGRWTLALLPLAALASIHTGQVADHWERGAERVRGAISKAHWVTPSRGLCDQFEVDSDGMGVQTGAGMVPVGT